MIHHTSSILCEQILANPRNNSLSYINTIHDRILDAPIEEGGTAKTSPFIVATKWFNDSKTESEIEIRVSVTPPEEDEHSIIGQTNVVFDKEAYVVAVNMEVVKFLVKKEGLYILKVEFKPTKNKRWKEATLLPLRVASQDQKASESI